MSGQIRQISFAARGGDEQEDESHGKTWRTLDHRETKGIILDSANPQDNSDPAHRRSHPSRAPTGSIYFHDFCAFFVVLFFALIESPLASK